MLKGNQENKTGRKREKKRCKGELDDDVGGRGEEDDKAGRQEMITAILLMRYSRQKSAK
jgi:hypothetical protein